MRTLMFIVAVSVTSSASAMSWDFGQPLKQASALPSAAAGGLLLSTPAAFSISDVTAGDAGKEAQATDGHFADISKMVAYADDCADGTCSVRRSGQPVRNLVKAVADEDRPRLFSGRILRRLFNGRLFGGCRGCN